MTKTAKIAVDIGGTFTDVALQLGAGASSFITAKTPTTQDPVKGAMHAVSLALDKAKLSPDHIASFIHGTTLATNALIERKGAKVGVITTEGFRDILEIAYERRYDQYNLLLDKPDMLVPRERCFVIPERMSATGTVLLQLKEDHLDEILAGFEREGVESVAICLLHSYTNPSHELRIAQLISQKRPHLFVSLSCEVSPEAREYDRLCTTVANAYIRPMMETYLKRLATVLQDDGFDCPLFIITSGGGMTTLETATRFPIRLVESGPSGGAILAAKVAHKCGLDQVVSFDMGGTTAKVCLIDDGEPQTSRHFEIGRADRFMKGSGLPVRIPVIEMIEIGAGGGSVAGVDRLGRITIGPESAGSEPGPACFGRGGQRATVTDADVTLGHIDVDAFAEGQLNIDRNLAEAAIQAEVGTKLELQPQDAAYGICQIVDENMANAGRVHAVECGKELGARTMIAFGGNGPLHATQVAEKMGLSKIVIPTDPGVGSAVGFLFAPVSYEIVRSHYTTLDQFDIDGVNQLFDTMHQEALRIVQQGAQDAPLCETRRAFMRYKGQGHEIEVSLPSRDLTQKDLVQLLVDYDTEYRALFSRSVPGMTVEIMNWAITVSTQQQRDIPTKMQQVVNTELIGIDHEVYFGVQRGQMSTPTYLRSALIAGDLISGPALIIESQTTTLVGPNFDALVDKQGYLILTRRHTSQGEEQ
jgi:N-methylhydantoinase A